MATVLTPRPRAVPAILQQNDGTDRLRDGACSGACTMASDQGKLGRSACRFCRAVDGHLVLIIVDSKAKRIEKVSVLSSPKNMDFRKKWIVPNKRDESSFFTVTKCTKVCSNHFTEENYLPNVAGNRRFLKQDAMPNIFAFSALRRPPRKKPRNQEPRNLVTATAATETSEDGRSTTEDVSDADFCAPSTSVASSSDDVMCGCAR
ncbi:hypothetical protein MRX96_044164 [Rhipicephalus microplus]